MNELGFYTAENEDHVIVIARADGTLFSAQFSILATGQPKVGEVWTVTLQSATTTQIWTVTLNADGTTTSVLSGTGVLTFSVIAVEGDTHATVARKLAQLINEWGLPEF